MPLYNETNVIVVVSPCHPNCSVLYVDLFAQDGVDNSGVKADALYTTPQQVNLCLYKYVTDLSQSFNRLEPFLAGVQSPSSTFPHQPHVLHRCCLR